MKIWSLQALRFWAALGVVAYHAYSRIYQTDGQLGVLGRDAALFGRGGVDVFFVLSGVIIALTSKGLTAGEFIAKRARRILPLYLLFTALYLAAGLVAGGTGWREVVTSLTLWPALDRMVIPVVPVAWTLCFEALFYASAAVVIWRPRLIWAVLGAYAAALAIRSGPILQFVGNPLGLEFLMGVGLSRLPRWRGAVWLIPAGLAAAWFLAPAGAPPEAQVADLLNGATGWRRALFLGVPAAAVVWGAMQIEMRKGLLTELGDASYALYLAHLPVVALVALGLARYTALPPDLIVVAAAAASVLLCWRIHLLFEKPMLAWLGRPAARRALTPAPDTPA
jgi:exopolysaccharide production protein ExoZ